MRNRPLKWFYSSFFNIGSPRALAVASSLGLFLGVLPLAGFNFLLIFFLSLLFRLNVLALILGTSITMFFGQLAPWGVGAHYHLPAGLLLGGLSALLSYPIFLFTYSHGMRSDAEKGKRNYIFTDLSGQRWRILKRQLLMISTVFLIIVYIFGTSLNVNPLFPSLHIKQTKSITNINPLDLPLYDSLNSHTLTSRLKKAAKKHPANQVDYNKSSVTTRNNNNSHKVYAFYVGWDENSTSSLKDHMGSIDVLIPEWYHLGANLTLESDIKPEIDRLAASTGLEEMPLINNFVDQGWDEAGTHKLLHSPEARSKLVLELLQEVKSHGYSGLNLDLEAIQPADRNLLTAFVAQLANAFHADGLKLTQDVPADDPAFDYQALARLTDGLIIMMYDEHFSSGGPGPIASLSWFTDTLKKQQIPEGKLIIALGNYGYDWVAGSNEPADTVTFGDIMKLADENALEIHWDSSSGNPYVSYQEDGDKHIIWFLDGGTLYNQVKASLAINQNFGFAMWRLGSEDPSIWDILGKTMGQTETPNRLETISTPDPVNYSGTGEILRVATTAKQGERKLQQDAAGYISSESYLSYPTPFAIERYGKPETKKIALTFDDGPNPQYTPQILDILRKYNIKADFFIVGENAEYNPELVGRIFREGHELGNHTFTHPNMSEISPFRIKMELNATQRLIQELTGHSTTIFRPPYVADAEPSTPGEIIPIIEAQNLGYTMVGELIDPQDWARPTSQEILRRIEEQLPQGNIILLHDAGGDRSETVKVLPELIETLENQGYTFVTVGQLIGKNKEELMPPATNDDTPFVYYDHTVFNVIKDWHNSLAGFFYLTIVLGVLRLILLLFLARKQSKKLPLSPSSRFQPNVSVVIAAYNEEKVIAKTLESILESDYPGLEIIVVNDGSTDATADVVQERFGSQPMIKLINKENGGKSSAINVGFLNAAGEIVVALDADTLIARNAISLLVGYFIDPKVAAVSGNVKVGNVHNLLTLWQHVEYVTGFNLERRAFAELNCVTVVPGAIGAWRKETVVGAGLFKEDTLAEDTDLTLSLLHLGYRVAYEAKAYAFTEAPADLKSLCKQRYRWTYGTLQCLWKHQQDLFSFHNKTLGFIALPNMWLFQYIFQSLSPIADIYFIWGLLTGNALITSIFYVAFLLVDLFTSFFAFKLEKEDAKPLRWLLLQRLIYRQIMTYVVLKSLLSAIKGITVGWNKLQRQGNVQKNV